ncbi:MAG: 3-hydroxyacyl-CoA dehydrogenase family protein [Nitrososphaerota archaeon]|nr:3-hydroxyacyl-CoA dehydrogenase family protein [Nitrososphaerota archaeon]
MADSSERKHITIIGFGLMGSQIAQLFAQNGFSVTAYDVVDSKLKEGLDLIKNGRHGLDSSVEKGRLDSNRARSALDNIKTTTSMDHALTGASFVLEAVVEDLEVKQEVMLKASNLSAPDAILATNTSTISISKISSELPHEARKRVVGMHFFNPPQVMKLVEIVKTKETSEEIVSSVSKIADSLGKTPIAVLDSPGFVANRIGISVFVEASYLLENGVANVRDIDLAMRLGYGYPMGPFELADIVGLDARLRNLQALWRDTEIERFKPPETLKSLVAQGYLGDPKLKKGSKGGLLRILRTGEAPLTRDLSSGTVPHQWAFIV